MMDVALALTAVAITMFGIMFLLATAFAIIMELGTCGESGDKSSDDGKDETL